MMIVIFITYVTKEESTQEPLLSFPLSLVYHWGKANKRRFI